MKNKGETNLEIIIKINPFDFYFVKIKKYIFKLKQLYLFIC